jgi:hypothetical protein
MMLQAVDVPPEGVAAKLLQLVPVIVMPLVPAVIAARIEAGVFGARLEA